MRAGGEDRLGSLRVCRVGGASGWDGAQLGVRVRRLLVLALLYHDVHLRLHPQAPFLPAQHPTKRLFNYRPTPLR
jgi:hypothetical protein